MSLMLAGVECCGMEYSPPATLFELEVLLLGLQLSQTLGVEAVVEAVPNAVF